MDESKSPIVFGRDNLLHNMALLLDWNKEHINDEPEQVRKNLETMADICVKFII